MDINSLPAEVILEIVKHLSGNDVLTCRKMCQRWELAIDGASDDFWSEICRRDYNDVYKDAFRKSKLSWRELCQCLHLWANVATADIAENEIPGRELTSTFRILDSAIISLTEEEDLDPKGLIMYEWTECNAIAYYDLVTMQEIRKENFEFLFNYYDENEVFMVQSNNNNGLLRIIPKANKERFLEVPVITEKQKKWALVGNKVYYLTQSHKIICVTLLEDKNNIKWETTTVTDAYVHNDSGDIEYLESIESMINIYDKQVNILTADEEGRLYSLIGNELKKIYVPNNSCDKIELLHKHGFNWLSEKVLSNTMFHGDPFEIYCAFFYGNVAIIVANYTQEIESKTALQIYLKPFREDGRLDLFNSKPVQSIDLPEHYVAVFQRIDVIEITNGHKIVISYGGEISVIELKHNSRIT